MISAKQTVSGALLLSAAAAPIAQAQAQEATLTPSRPQGAAGCLFWRSPEPSAAPPCVALQFAAEMEAVNLRNKGLRLGDKRSNKLELEPLLRLNAQFMKNSPVDGGLELEWQRVIKRESAKPARKQTRLNLNQAWVRLTDRVIPHTEWKLGRWLYRDEREWLIDENLDGLGLRWKYVDWSADLLLARVNLWQKDLMDRTSRNTDPVNIIGVLLRRQLTDDWHIGLYGFNQHNVSNHRFRQSHYGIRSYSEEAKRFNHWLEAGFAKGHNKSDRIQGYVFDIGATYAFKMSGIKPYLTLGYTASSKNYTQTGLQGNEAKFGGDTKFKIYGETLDPLLRNLQIFTLGIGANIGKKASLDLVYHDYSQLRREKIANKAIALSPKYDRQTTRRLGYGIDLIYGWKPTSSVKLETRLGIFQPSARFASGSKASSPRSQPASFAAVELKIAF
ncbi:alginate export family protein [Mixta tenebrionis]|uniref:Alginate export domain-containing protein n=1 Tax=Mixta tenebrionis TaxID=2562439 RepID=A0A506V8L6_9GAMM|nr:alginate export family protein [Mixta tenebrionis]TPW42274.1 hypothetical protein FKM52_09565 [Mixta tenebrionis]